MTTVKYIIKIQHILASMTSLAFLNNLAESWPVFNGFRAPLSFDVLDDFLAVFCVEKYRGCEPINVC